ncbi:hypothetical protein [Aureibacter tunicatorum]|uniref:Uncharacterized protein n=1 Tax=Aureibacter tunicatorum TaxID=866807 RepID=A0AAE3XT39_9BACT|nr:hypothetical protein [Aureibacter tunicatorum]MDR6241515.1 hypothetical protein [Aureibacter tunicatorum]BDD07027.1 hypothetical protein AUTU_45100 [Aureibacter tunicatorum]
MIIYEYIYLQIYRIYNLGGTDPDISARIALSIVIAIDLLVLNFYLKKIDYELNSVYLFSLMVIIGVFNLFYFSKKKTESIVEYFKNEKFKLIKSILVLIIIFIYPLWILITKMP